ADGTRFSVKHMTFGYTGPPCSATDCRTERAPASGNDEACYGVSVRACWTGCDAYGRDSSMPAARSRSVRRALLLAILALGPAAAQSTLDRIRDQTTQAPDTSLCIPRDTRAAPHCDPKQTVVRTEKQQTFSLELPAPSSKYCAAAIEFE